MSDITLQYFWKAMTTIQNSHLYFTVCCCFKVGLPKLAEHSKDFYENHL